MNYSVVSQNTTCFLSLHDCVCSRMHCDGKKLVMEMEWMEVLDTHPNNPFAKSHQSGPGIIELHSPAFTEVTIFKKPKKNSKNELVWSDPEPIALQQFEYHNLELLSFKEETCDTGYIAEIFLDFDHQKSDCESMCLTVSYSRSVVMYNELSGESWFEDEKWKHPK